MLTYHLKASQWILGMAHYYHTNFPKGPSYHIQMYDVYNMSCKKTLSSHYAHFAKRKPT